MSSVSGNRPIQVTTTDVKPMFGKPKTKITLEREGKTTAILGKAITDLNDTKVQGKLSSRKYVLLEINNKTYLVKIDRLRKSLYTSEASVAKGRGLAPTDTMSEIKKAMNKAAPNAPAIATGDDLLARLEHEANLAKTGMTPKEAQAIVKFAADLKAGKAKTKDGKPISYPPNPALYIKKDSVKPALKCSLNVLSNGQVCVLLKSKVGILEAFKMKAKGSFKTVKTALNMHTGELLAHSVLDITKETDKRYAELYPKKNSPNPEQDKSIIKEQVMKEIKQECTYQTQFSPRIAIKEEDIVTYTDKNGHTKVSFPCTKAIGDAYDLAQNKDQRLTHMLYNPKELKRNLVGLADSLAKLHAEGLVFRDAKPENILGVDEKNPDGSPVLNSHNKPTITLARADYGLAKPLTEAAKKTEGSLNTIAPDVYFGKGDEDKLKQADMWSDAAATLDVLTDSTTIFNYYLIRPDRKGPPNPAHLQGLIQGTVTAAKNIMLARGYKENLADLYAQPIRSKEVPSCGRVPGCARQIAAR